MEKENALQTTNISSILTKEIKKINISGRS
jgi:hypothetical protein